MRTLANLKTHVLILAIAYLAISFSVLAQDAETNPTLKPATELTIAVASNFRHTLIALLKDYRQSPVLKDKVISASSGQLFSQIQNGAPFDIFFSADRQRPDRLEQLGLTDPHSRRTYAVGQLALWINPNFKHQLNKEQQALSNLSLLKSLTAENLPKSTVLALANVKAAPYGYAAKTLLENLQIWQLWQPLVVQAGNVAQVYQYVESGNVSLALLSLAQLKLAQVPESEYETVPAELYTAIDQQLVILQAAKNQIAAQAFVDYLKTPKAHSIISRSGYNLPYSDSSGKALR